MSFSSSWDVKDSSCDCVRRPERRGGTSGVIVQSARDLFERDGVAATTVKSVAEKSDVTRELVYYYFPNKNALIGAVLNDYVCDLVESVVAWNETRRFGDTPGELARCVKSLRYALYDASGAPRAMVRVLDELGVRDAFDVRAVRATVDCINHDVVSEYARYHRIEIALVYEMFCVTIFGLVGLLKLRPSITDEELQLIVAQTLRLDMRVIDESQAPVG